MATKTKGQRLDNGEYQEFYDVDAIHTLKDNVGNEYTLALDNQNNVVAVEKTQPQTPPEIVVDGLIHRYKVVDGVLTDVVTDTTITSGVTYDGDWFKCANLGISSAQHGSVEVVGKMETQGSGGSYGLSVTTSNGTQPASAKPKTPGLANAWGTGLELYSGFNYSRFSRDERSSCKDDFYDRTITPKLRFFPPSESIEQRKFAANDKFTYGLYFDLDAVAENNKKASLNGLTIYNDNSAYNITSENGAKVVGSNSKFFLEIRVYNRVLTDEEIEENAKVDGTHYSTLVPVRVEQCYDGYAPFGASPALESLDSGYPNLPASSDGNVGTHTDASGHEFTISALTPYAEPERVDSGLFEGVQFINKPTTLYTFRKYSVCAMPYPLNGDMIANSDSACKFHIMYSSSDDSICECVDGVLIPKAAGTVTITARLAGSQLTDTFTATIAVYDDSVPEINTLYVPKTYSVGIHALNSKNPKSCALAMFSAIKSAGESGYHKVVFPKMDYTIYPVFDYGDENDCCLMPSNFQIDFSGSNIYIAENPYCFVSTARNYHLFRFTDGCNHSSIKNVTFYGERHFNVDNHLESEYQDHCGIILYDNCYMCGTDKVNFHDTVGFYYGFDTSGQYDYWSGIWDSNWSENSGLANRGRIRANEFEVGDLDANGNAIESTDYIRTKGLMHIGYEPSDLAKFCFGTMGDQFYSKIKSRWVRVWWYDSNRTLLNVGGTLYFQYSEYELPAGAQYFKLTAFQSAVPDGNVGEDGCVLRIFPFKHATHCYATNMVSLNPHGWAISETGGQNNYVGNAVLDMTKRYSYWSIDLEDNAMTMQSNVFDNIVGAGCQLYGGYGHAVLSYFGSTSYRTINMRDDCQGCRIMNCTVASLFKSAKLDTVIRGVKVGSVGTGTTTGSMIETDITTGIDIRNY